MKSNRKILICLNEPKGKYNNYIGKDFNNPNDNVDLSESSFYQSTELIKKSLRKNFIQVDEFIFNHNLHKAIRHILDYSPQFLGFQNAVDLSRGVPTPISQIL